MTIWIALAVAAIAFLSATTLSLTAFGFAIIMVPLASLVWEVKPAIATSTILWTILMIPLLFEVRSHVKPARVTPLLIASIAAIPGGILLIRHIDPDALQIVIASIAIVVAVVFYFAPRIRLERPRMSLSLLIGGITGFINSSTGMGGPPMVLYILSFERGIEGMRATLLPVLFVTGVLTLIGLAISGIINRDVLIAAGVALPSVAAGAVIGAWLRYRISAALFRTVTLTLIVVTSVSALVSASGLLN